MSTVPRLTVADVEALPDRLDDTRYELIDGVLWVTTQPHWEHQLTGAILHAALLDWSLSTGRGVPNIAPGLIFSPEEAVAPDVVWISQERLARGLGDDGKLHVAPELVVELLSPGATNERRDREVKLKLYAQRGVEEYWIVDWRARTVAVYRRADGELALAATLTAADALTSPLLPGFSFPVAGLWRLSRGR
jgi:Uma2 family endonuclease